MQPIFNKKVLSLTIQKIKSKNQFLHSFFVNSSVTTSPSSQRTLNLRSFDRAVVALLSCKSRHSHVTSANMSSALSLGERFGVGGFVANEGPACIRQLGCRPPHGLVDIGSAELLLCNIFSCWPSLHLLFALYSAAVTLIKYPYLAKLVNFQVFFWKSFFASLHNIGPVA